MLNTYEVKYEFKDIIIHITADSKEEAALVAKCKAQYSPEKFDIKLDSITINKI